MSYQTVRLSYNPAIYLRLDMTGPANNGDEIPDISGNDLPADLAFVPGGIEPYGHTSPIESDADSRAFRGYNAGELVGNTFAIITRSSDSLIEPDGDLTFDGWFSPRVLGITLAGKRNDAGTDYCFSIAINTSGRLVAQLKDSAGTSYTATSPGFGGDQEELLGGDYYYVALVRVGNVLQLWINAELHAQTTITSGLPTLDEGGDLRLGAGISGPYLCFYDEVALNTDALNDAALLDIYESAFLSLPMSGRADLHLVGTLDGLETPTPLFFPFPHNWESVVKETLVWQTDVIAAEQDYEQRAGIRQRPRRILEFDAFVGDNKLRRRFHAFLFQNQGKPIYLGDWTEAALLTQNVLSGATSLSFSAQRRGYEDGGRVAIFQDEDHFEIVTLDTVGDSSSTLVGETAEAWSKHTAFVVPVVRALVAEDLQFDRHTDQLEEGQILFRVLAQDVPLAPRRNGTYSPRYTYQDIEVFDPFVLGVNNWSDDGRGRVTVRGRDIDTPSGLFGRTARDSASSEIVSYTFELDGRIEIARFLAWLWSIQGMRVPLWVPTLQEDFIPVSTSGTNPALLVVEGHDYTDFYQNHEARRDIAFIYYDDTIVSKRIESSATDGDNDELTIEQEGALSLANLRAISFLKLSRLNEDTIQLVWHTDELVEVTLNFVDLLTTP